MSSFSIAKNKTINKIHSHRLMTVSYTSMQNRMTNLTAKTSTSMQASLSFIKTINYYANFFEDLFLICICISPHNKKLQEFLCRHLKYLRKTHEEKNLCGISEYFVQITNKISTVKKKKKESERVKQVDTCQWTFSNEINLLKVGRTKLFINSSF